MSDASSSGGFGVAGGNLSFSSDAGSDVGSGAGSDAPSEPKTRNRARLAARNASVGLACAFLIVNGALSAETDAVMDAYAKGRATDP